MWKYRACPRCGGDIFMDRDEGGWFESCLQCGYRLELESVYDRDATKNKRIVARH
jgi:hypothetical protein